MYVPDDALSQVRLTEFDKVVFQGRTSYHGFENETGSESYSDATDAFWAHTGWLWRIS